MGSHYSQQELPLNQPTETFDWESMVFTTKGFWSTKEFASMKQFITCLQMTLCLEAMWHRFRRLRCTRLDCSGALWLNYCTISAFTAQQAQLKRCTKENGLTSKSRVWEERGIARKYNRQPSARTNQRKPAINRKKDEHTTFLRCETSIDWLVHLFWGVKPNPQLCERMLWKRKPGSRKESSVALPSSGMLHGTLNYRSGYL